MNSNWSYIFTCLDIYKSNKQKRNKYIMIEKQDKDSIKLFHDDIEPSLKNIQFPFIYDLTTDPNLTCDLLEQVISSAKEQGKSEGFESCDRPIVRKCPIWVKIGDVLSRVTLKFDGWPWKTIGHLSFAVSNFVKHCIAIGVFKLELQSGNAGFFGSNSTIFRAVWPWNLTNDLEKQ